LLRASEVVITSLQHDSRTAKDAREKSPLTDIEIAATNGRPNDEVHVATNVLLYSLAQSSHFVPVDHADHEYVDVAAGLVSTRCEGTEDLGGAHAPHATEAAAEDSSDVPLAAQQITDTRDAIVAHLGCPQPQVRDFAAGDRTCAKQVLECELCRVRIRRDAPRYFARVQRVAGRTREKAERSARRRTSAKEVSEEGHSSTLQQSLYYLQQSL
jgi:hypothetical protein